MKVTDLAKELVSNDEIKEVTKSLVEDTVSAILGDPVAVGKIIYTILNSPTFLRERLFWMKFEMFLNGIDSVGGDREKFCLKLGLISGKKNNAYRLIHIIDHFDGETKIKYMINASKCLIRGYIDRTFYFRICHIIKNSIEEDLFFLKDHIIENGEYEYDDIIQGLMTNGLAYQSVFDSNGKDDKYKFTNMAKMLDCYALSSDNDDRYLGEQGESMDKEDENFKKRSKFKGLTVRLG